MQPLFNRSGSKQFFRFLLAGGTAATANYCSRFLFSEFFSFQVAIFLAFLVGLSCGFVLNRTYVFWGSSQHVFAETCYYVLVNLFALLQTWLLSTYWAVLLEPDFGVEMAQAIAHLAGIMLPVFSSFLGHRYLTFRGSHNVDER